MCFNRHGKMQVAKKAIIVYKGLYINSNNQELISPYRSTVWKVKKKKVENKMAKNSYRQRLSFGFHSCKTIDTARLHASRVYEFVIPKGALYYENDSEYLSNEIYLKSANRVN